MSSWLPSPPDLDEGVLVAAALARPAGRQARSTTTKSPVLGGAALDGIEARGLLAQAVDLARRRPRRLASARRPFTASPLYSGSSTMGRVSKTARKVMGWFSSILRSVTLGAARGLRPRPSSSSKTTG